MTTRRAAAHPESALERTPRTSRLLTAWAAAALLALSAVPAHAQDEPAPEPAATTTADGADAQRAEALLGRLRALYVVASERPTTDAIRAATGDPEAVGKARARFAAAKREWEQALAALPDLAERYFEAAGEAPAPNAFFFDGYARATRASIASKAEVDELLERAAASLTEYLDRAPRDAAYRVEAERTAAYALVRLAKGDGEKLLLAVPHADAGVRGYLAEGRGAEAGSVAHLMLNSLIAADQKTRASQLANGWDVEKADLGPSTDGVRMLARRSRLRPGEKLAELPALEDYTGAPMPWSELAGKPFVLHFFSTVVSTPTREVETILRPLKKEYGASNGLVIVGCSTDRAMTADEIARTKANWEEWGKTDVLRDGTLPSVREWAEQREMDWPWYWDGKWMHNDLVKTVGAPVSGPYAIFVDAEGRIVWCGKPFDGLKEAVAKALGN
jgi:hypothetical protein